MATPDRYIVDLAGTKKTSFKVGNAFALLTSRNINTAAGELTGGGDLSADRTLGLANTAVVPTTYGNAATIPEITVDAKGRITAAVNRTITPGGIGASAIGHTHVPADITNFYQYGITGVKSITGGGTLAADRTMELVNDSASPGLTQYYGTNGSGTKGWFSLLGQDLVGLRTAAIVGELILTKAGSNPRTLIAPDASGTIRLVEDSYASLAFNTVSGAPAYGEGKLYWDNNDHTLAVMTEINGVTIQLGQEELVRARNQTGSTILNGQVVYVNGASGSRPTIALALATSVLSDKVIGICTYDIANNAVGYVTRGGLVRDVNTFAWAEGTELYVSDSVAGDLTDVPPVAPNHAVRVGVVLYSHSSNGIIMVHVDTGNSLNDLHDVYLSAPANKNALRYVTANNRWENTDQGAWLDTAQSFSALQTFGAGAIVSDLTSTYMVVAGASGRLQNSAIIQGSITGAMTINKNGTTARAYTFIDAALTIAGSASLLTTVRVPYVTTGGVLKDADWFFTDEANQKLVVGNGSTAAQAELSVQRTAGQNGLITLRTGTLSRWRFILNGTESGADAGGLFSIQAYSDAGAFIDAPFSIVRAAGGAITLARPVTCSSTLSCTSITASGLTSGQLPVVTTGGLLSSSNVFTYSAQTLIAGNGTASAAYFQVNTAAGQDRGLVIQTAGVFRWIVRFDSTAESGANAGTNFVLRAYSDAGAAIDSPIGIVRAAGGAITLARPVSCTSTLSATSLTASGLTSGRVPFAGTGGLLGDNAGLTFSAAGGGGLTLANTSSSFYLIISRAAGFAGGIVWSTSGSVRWIAQVETGAETGSNAGSDWSLLARTDAGAAIDSPIAIVRAAGGAITLARPTIVSYSGAQFTVGNGTGAPRVLIDGAAANGRFVNWRTGGSTRWQAGADTAAESGANAGSAWILSAYTDAAALIDNPIVVTRAAGGAITTTRPIAMSYSGALLTVGDGTGAPFIRINGAAAQSRGVMIRTNSSNRFYFYTDATAETGANAGSNFGISAYDDAGAFIDSPLTIVRAAGGTLAISRPTQHVGTMSVGSAPLSYQGLALYGKVLSGSGTHFGINCALTYGSDATAVRALTLNIATDVATFTVANAYGLYINNPTAGSGSAITTMYGIYMESLTTPTNRYAIYTAGNGLVRFGDTLEASVLGTAAIISLGGLSVAKNIICGQALNVGSIVAGQIQSTAGRILLSSSATDATSKATYILNAHYTNAEEPFGTILASSNNGTNLLMLGGGSASYNAATSVSIYTGATSATVTGTDRFNVDANGIITISNTTNATTASDGSVRLAGGLSIATGKDIVCGGLIKSLSGTNTSQISASSGSFYNTNGTVNATIGMAMANDGISTGSIAGDIVLRAVTTGARIFVSNGRVVLADTTDATLVTDGALVIPGGISCAKSFVSTASTVGAHYWGPSGTDGSVRVYGNGSGALIVEKRVSGSWTEIGRFA